MNKEILKHIILFPIFFGILFLEEFTFFGVQFTILWKIPLVIYLFIYLKNRNDSNSVPNYLFLGLLFAFKVFIITDFPESLPASFNRFIKFSILPLSVFFFTSYYKSFKKLNDALVTLSVYLILATLPYYLGVEDRISNAKVDVFGADEEWIGFTAYFLKVHALSIVMGFASIILVAMLANAKMRTLNKMFYFLVLILAMVSMYRTFVRTGWLMFALAAFALFFYKQNILKSFRLIPIVVIFIFVIINVYNNSEALQTKLSDRTIWQEETTVEDLGSGRVKYYLTALENWKDAGLGAWLIGYGEKEGKRLMEEKIGSALFAHNAYIEILQTNGIIGFLIFIAFLYALYKFSVKGCRNLYFVRLGTASFLAYISALFFQSANIFWLDVLFALVISMIHLNKKQTQMVKNG